MPIAAVPQNGRHVGLCLLEIADASSRVPEDMVPYVGVPQSGPRT